MRIRRRPAPVLSSSLQNPDPPEEAEIPADKHQKTVTADRGEEYEERRAQRVHLVLDLNREAITSSFTCNHQAINKEETPNLEDSHSQQFWINGSKSNGGKEEIRKRRSPAVLMEGSRCSRVNGRGWRCCQQTLVGYSLCEHHLGKGRLRSISTVKGRHLGSKMPDAPEKPMKARSINSLLDDSSASNSAPLPETTMPPLPS